MTLYFPKWIDKYDDENSDESIEYRDGSGAWKVEDDPLLSSISKQFQQRGYIFRDELRRIGEWKASGRVDHHIKQNNSTSVERQSKLAFQASEDKDSVEFLTELQGVSVPIASAVLAMYDPGSYAVVDYRAFRALGAAEPNLLDPRTYSDYAKFMEKSRGYNSNSGGYIFYLKVVRNIAQREVISPREVDMALWAFDEENAP